MRLTALAAATAFALAMGATAWAQTAPQQAPAQGQTKGQPKGQTKGQQAPTPQQDDDSGQVFDDWRVRCEKPQGATAERCIMIQNVVAQGNEGRRTRLLGVAIGYGDADGQRITVMQFTVPLGLYLPSGIGLQIEQQQPVKVAIEVCAQQGCIARYRLEDAMRVSMQKGTTAQAVLTDANRQSLPVPISLKGFSKAFAALK